MQEHSPAPELPLKSSNWPLTSARPSAVTQASRQVVASVTGETPFLLKLLHSGYVISSSPHPSKAAKHAAATAMTMQRDQRIMDMPLKTPLALASWAAIAQLFAPWTQMTESYRCASGIHVSADKKSHSMFGNMRHKPSNFNPIRFVSAHCRISKCPKLNSASPLAIFTTAFFCGSAE